MTELSRRQLLATASGVGAATMLAGAAVLEDDLPVDDDVAAVKAFNADAPEGCVDFTTFPDV